jgi:hypothetical protein
VRSYLSTGTTLPYLVYLASQQCYAIPSWGYPFPPAWNKFCKAVAAEIFILIPEPSLHSSLDFIIWIMTLESHVSVIGVARCRMWAVMRMWYKQNSAVQSLPLWNVVWVVLHCHSEERRLLRCSEV